MTAPSPIEIIQNNRRELAMSLGTGSWHVTTDTAISVIEGLQSDSPYFGTRKLLIEAAASIALGIGDKVVPLPSVFMAAMSLDNLAHHAFHPTPRDTETQDRCLAYLRRLGMVDREAVENDGLAREQHLLIEKSVSIPFEG